MDLNEKEIRGVNIKQVVAYTILIGGLFAGWFTIKNEIQINRQETLITRELLKTMEQNQQEEREFMRLEIQALRAQLNEINGEQRSLNIRLTVLETKLTK